MANDYNRALPAPVRWAHVGAGALAAALRPVFAPGTRQWAPALLAGLIGFVLLWPYDGPLQAGARALEADLDGDLRRELFAWQQFGQGFAIVFAAVVIWLVDPARRRRLLDLAAAVALCQAASSLGKVLIGRPRPREHLLDSGTFLGPWGEYPVRREGGWELASAWTGGADLWSMPSSHTMFAVMLGVFLWRLYPRLGPLCALAATIVGFGRVVFGGHWPTDVVVGAAVGFAIANPAVARMWGVRLLDWAWIRFVDAGARPVYPALRDEAEGRRVR